MRKGERRWDITLCHGGDPSTYARRGRCVSVCEREVLEMDDDATKNEWELGLED